MVNDLQAEENEKNVKEAERFAALVLAGPSDTFDLVEFEMHYMYSTLLEMTPEELETDGAVTKKLLLDMVEELHEMLERTIIANTAKTEPGQLFYWIDDFAGTGAWHDWCRTLNPEEE